LDLEGFEEIRVVFWKHGLALSMDTLPHRRFDEDEEGRRD